MAFYNEDEEQQDPNAPQGGVQTAQESGVITGAGGAGASGPQQATAAPDKGSNFVGIKQYLDANKPQAAKLGDQTAGVINSSANQAREGVNQLNQEAQSTIKPVSSLGQDILGKLNSSAETLSGDERKQIKDTASAQYQGPQDATQLSGYQNAQKATKTAVDNIANSGTEQGRMNLISQVNSKPRTQGMNVFDNTLLQAGGGREKLAQAATANQDVKGGLDAAAQAIQGKASQAKTQTQTAQADAYKSVQDALSAWQTGFTPKVAQEQQRAVDLNNRVTQDFGDDPLTLAQETLDLYGLSDGQDTYGADLGALFRQGDVNTITPETVGTSEDYARYSALSDLAGIDPTLLNPQNASKAGTAQLAGVDKDAVMKAIEGKKGQYEAEKQKATDKFNQLKAAAYAPLRGDEMMYLNPETLDVRPSFSGNPSARALAQARQTQIAAANKAKKDIQALDDAYNKKVKKG